MVAKRAFISKRFAIWVLIGSLLNSQLLAFALIALLRALWQKRKGKRIVRGICLQGIFDEFAYSLRFDYK